MIKILKVLFFSCLLWSCQEKAKNSEKTTTVAVAPKFKNKGHQLIYNMSQKAGTYQQLLNLKDVVYTYTYTTPNNETDIATEKYLFDGELSYAKYHKHQRTLPNLEGEIEQGYDGKQFWLRNKEGYIQDKNALKKVTFNRITNFYWFTMFQKLLDPGINYEYLKEVSMDDTLYDIVKITFTSNDENPTDTYQIYINKKTGLIDQFLFTVVDYGVIDTPFLMKVEYEKINGLFIPTKRKYTKATWEAKNLTDNWIHVTWTNIKFNNGLTKELFEYKK